MCLRTTQTDICAQHNEYNKPVLAGQTGPYGAFSRGSIVQDRELSMTCSCLVEGPGGERGGGELYCVSAPYADYLARMALKPVSALA